MPHQTVLPSLAPFQEISWLKAWLIYLWGCYQALMDNYQVLQAQNIRLQQIAKYAEQRAADAEQRAADAEEAAADWQYYAEKTEQKLEAIMQRDEAEAAILHELSLDRDWSSVSKRNFVAKQTNAVLEAKRQTAQIQAELDNLKRLIAQLLQSMPFDGVTQEPVMYPAIIVPSDPRMDAKIVNKGSAMNLITHMKSKFPMGQDVTIQKVYECADVKTMYEGIFKLLKLCGHKLDE